MSHTAIDPAILYWGTPVVLITSLNDDGTSNISPMSSAFWLGNRCMIGLEAVSKTTQNIFRTGQCVLNLPSDDLTDAVNAMARTTGSEPVPEGKLRRGYTCDKDKFTTAKLTPQPSETVAPPRIQECPVQMEGKYVGRYELFGGAIVVIEIEVVKTFVLDKLRLAGHENRIDSDAWRPMIMSFQNLYGLRDGKLGGSKLARIDEELYRIPK